MKQPKPLDWVYGVEDEINGGQHTRYAPRHKGHDETAAPGATLGIVDLFDGLNLFQFIRQLLYILIVVAKVGMIILEHPMEGVVSFHGFRISLRRRSPRDKR